MRMNGYGSLVIPGVKIGNGAIVSSRAFVVAELERIAWWDWPIEKVSAHLRAIMGADLTALRAAHGG